jgi:cyclic pyranopterin phosphate synthase
MPAGKPSSLRMVNIGAKATTRRCARAGCVIRLKRETLRALTAGRLAKGDAIAAAQLAGIQAAKRAWELIPLCHPIPLTSVEVQLTPRPEEGTIRVESRVETRARTGVEMEALAAVAAAALTVYDMCKSRDPGLEISGLCLLEKSGGKSGKWRKPAC